MLPYNYRVLRTSIGDRYEELVLYVNIVTLCDVAPKIILNCVLSNGISEIRNIDVVPSQIDSILKGFYIDLRGQRNTFDTSLDRADIFPVLSVAGQVSFKILKNSNEFTTSMTLMIT